MKFKRLEVKNFRCFDSLVMELHPRLNVLMGMNDVGKTTLLDAMAIGLDECVSVFNNSSKMQIRQEDIRLKKIDNSMIAGFPVQIQCLVGGEEHPQFEWSTVLQNSQGHILIRDGKQIQEWAKKLKMSVESSEETVLPLCVYYGTHRLWEKYNNKSLFSINKPQNIPLQGYINSLNPSSTYQEFQNDFINWHYSHLNTLTEQEEQEKSLRFNQIKNIFRFKDEKTDQELIALIEKTLTTHDYQPDDYSRLIHTVQMAVSQCVEGWKDLRYEASNREIIVSHQTQGDIPLRYLSEGIRNMIAMVADIAYRTLLLNPHFGEQAPLKTRGMVLIDDIELHLHPYWQKTILNRLTNAFPQLQFIVTTQSPDILTTVRPENIQLFRSEHMTLESSEIVEGVKKNSEITGGGNYLPY